jgi:hypothetical protein
MPFTSIGSIADAIENGQYHEQIWYKTGSPTIGSAGRCYDLSMGAGLPRYNAYVGTQYEFTPLAGAGNIGIYTGAIDSTKSTYLTKSLIYDTTASRYPGVFVLLDYLGFYPLVDGDSTDLQTFDNSTSVPRLPTKGAKIMIVSTVPQSSGLSSTATITYTNQNGVAGQTTTCRLDTSSVLGEVINCENRASGAAQAQRFVSLANGDTGVQSIQSLSLNTAAGGFFAVVLVNPLVDLPYIEAGTPSEYEMIQHKGFTPLIQPNAYLNFILQATAGGAGTVSPRGLLTFTRA